MLLKEDVLGEVKWFSSERGFGFIVNPEPEGKDIFVHYSFIEMEGYKTLNKGDKVMYDLHDEDIGLQAKRVRPIKD